MFVLEDTDTGTVAGICAIEVAVGLNDPWYNYRVGTMVHASKELNVYNALPTLFLCNDHTGASELCTLFLDPAWRKEGNGYLLPNRALCLLPLSAIVLTKRWWPKCAV